MNMYYDKQIKGYTIFLILFAFLLFGMALIFGMIQINSAKALYLENGEAVASSLLEQGVPRDVIAAALTNTEISEAGQNLLAAAGIGSRTDNRMLPFIRQFQQSTLDSLMIGMLRCIGATKKQIMRLVRREGLCWCKCAIPIGLAGGMAVVWILCAALKWIIPDYFSEMPVFHVSGISIVCGVAAGVLTVLLASRSPAKKAARVSPLMAVSGNAYPLKSVRTAANTRLFRIVASLGVHHAASNRKNFVLMIGSFAISIIMFLSFSPLIDFMNHAINPLEPCTPDVSIISKEDNTLSVPKELAEQFESLDFVKRVYGRMFAYDIPTGDNQKINCINENHALDAWFKKAYGGEEKSLLRL